MLVPDDKLQKINDDVKQRGYVDREHILQFLQALPTNDASTIISEVKAWLQYLHDDSDYDKVRFADGDIDAVIGDLDSYGRVQPQTILEYKQTSNKVPPQT